MDDNPLAAWLRDGPTSAADPAQATADHGPGGRPEIDDPDANRWRRLRRLLLFAAVPWIVVPLVLLAGRGGPVTPPALAPPAPRQAPLPTAAASPAGAGATSPIDAAGADAVADAVAAADTVDRADVAAAAAATLAVRAAVTDGRSRYVDTVAVESVTALETVRLVTVRAMVLHGRGGVWRGQRPARYAVPVDVDARDPGAAAALADPWPLRTPDGHEAARAWVPAPERVTPAQREAVRTALQEAGFRRVGALRLGGVRIGSTAPLHGLQAARVTARGPGEAAVRRHEVWLAGAPPAVLGTPPDGSAGYGGDAATADPSGGAQEP